MSTSPAVKYATSNMYNFKNILELYAKQNFNFDKVHIQHGAYNDKFIPVTDLHTNAEIMFVWSKTFKELWEKESDIPCYILGAPFAHFRRMKMIKQSKSAKGTIAYPLHSIQNIQISYDIDDYCEKLRNLPEEFQPVTVCLHYYDILKYGADKEYEKRGFNTVCARDIEAIRKTGKTTAADFEYPIGFYRDLRNHKYASANTAGTCAFYAVEMGIPFFLLGEPPISDNSQGIEPNLPKKKNIYDASYTPHVKHFFDLFTHEDKTVITPEQKEYVYSALGINDCISREELCKILKELG